MEQKLSFINETVANEFATALKEERKIESKIDKEDKKFVVSFSLAKRFAECKGHCGEGEATTEDDRHVTMDDLNSFVSFILSEMQWQLNWLSSDVSYLSSSLYRHTESGHLPPIKGAGKMADALKTLGIDDDYDVRKPEIRASTRSYASLGGNRPTVEVDLIPSKEN